MILAAYSEYSGEPGEVPVPEVVKEPRRAVADEGVTLWSEALGAAAIRARSLPPPTIWR